VRPVGIAHGAVLDGLPLEAVEEEDDGHDEGRHQAPRHGPVQIRSGIIKGKSNEMDNFGRKEQTKYFCMWVDVFFQNFCPCLFAVYSDIYSNSKLLVDLLNHKAAISSPKKCFRKAVYDPKVTTVGRQIHKSKRFELKYHTIKKIITVSER
jgi:hypothetical protein